MKFNLKCIKMSESRNGYSLIATLWIDNLIVCKIRDIGDGSEPSFDVFNKEIFNKWEMAIAQLPEIYIDKFDMNFKIDKAMFIDLLHEALVNKSEFKLLAA